MSNKWWSLKNWKIKYKEQSLCVEKQEGEHGFEILFHGSSGLPEPS